MGSRVVRNQEARYGRIQRLHELVASSVLVLDGAMGTMIQAANLDDRYYTGDFSRDQRGNHDILVLTAPEVISGIHTAYLEAGAHIIETNTFNANGVSQKEYGNESLVYEMNRRAAELARSAADAAADTSGIPRFVAGSIGPTSKMASIPSRFNEPEHRDVSFVGFAQGYEKQIEGLMDGGADILLVETCFDALTCKAALYAAKQVFARKEFALPLMVSITIADASGRTLTGQTCEAFYRAVEPYRLFSIGVNCSFGAGGLIPFVEELGRIAVCAVSMHPNAGLPDSLGAYSQTPETMINELQPVFSLRMVNIIGGCCGTTPAHIARIAQEADLAKPRDFSSEPTGIGLSGLVELPLASEGSVLIVGERTNVAGSRKFARLIQQELWDDASDIAREEVEAGAHILDVCMDDGQIDGVQAMTGFLRRTAGEPDIARVPIMVDSSKWEIIEAGLQNLQGRGIANSISLKEGEEVFLSRARAIADYGAAMVVMLFDERGQADTYSRKIEIARRSYDLLVNADIAPRDIIFDPNILAIGTGIAEHDAFARDYLQAVSWIKQNLPGVSVIGGISNLSFAFRGNQQIRDIMHAVFLHHAVQAGLDFCIINPSMNLLYHDIPQDVRTVTEDAMLLKYDDAPEQLFVLAQKTAAQARGQSSAGDQETDAWRSLPVGKRLAYSVINGVSRYLKADLEVAMQEYNSAVSIIEGPLMDGIKEVGNRFEQGDLFLPQVVKSSRIMREAAVLLEPHMSADQAENRTGTLGSVLLATVHGDVHDIGKHLVSLVLKCNRYQVIDLGVMVTAARIVQAAENHQPDVIGLSGLITPSLDEMVHTARELERNGFSIPLLIGGATTSEEFVRKRIQPVYHGTAAYVRDASRSVQSVLQVMSDAAKHEASEHDNEDHAHLVHIELARANRPNKYVDPVDVPDVQGIIIPEAVPLKDIEQYISWKMLLAAWRVPLDSSAGRETLQDAKALFNELADNEQFFPRGVVGLFPVRRYEDDAVVYSPESLKNEVERDTAVPLGVLHFLRRQEADKELQSLADLLIPAIMEDMNAREDYLGIFAATAGRAWQERTQKLREEQDDYRALMTAILADRVVEAYSEYLHMRVRKEWWGYSKDESLTPEEMRKGVYRGIRPAVGYPACPDHSEKKMICTILGVQKHLGITLTPTLSMDPPASLCGYYFSSPEASYFSIGTIGSDQLEDYANRKGWTPEKIPSWIRSIAVDQGQHINVINGEKEPT